MPKHNKILSVTITYPYMCDGEPCTQSVDVDFYYDELVKFFSQLETYLTSINFIGVFNWNHFIETHKSTITEFLLDSENRNSYAVYYSFEPYQFKMRKVLPL